MGVYFSGSVLKVTLVFNYEKEMFCEFGDVASELPFGTIVSPLKEAYAILLPLLEPAHPSQSPSPALGQSHSPLTIFCSS